MTNEKINVAEIKRLIAEYRNGNLKKKYHGSGIALLKTVEDGVTSKGDHKITGILANKEEVKYQIWSDSGVYWLPVKTPGMVVCVEYEIGKYGLVLKEMAEVEGYDPKEFI